MKDNNANNNTNMKQTVLFEIDKHNAEIVESLEKAEAVDSSVSAKKKRKSHKDKKTDRELVQEFLNNPTHEHFNVLFLRFYYGLRKYAFGIVKEFDIATDIVISTFEIAWDKWQSYDSEKGEFSTWLYRICRNACLLYLKDKKKRNLIDQDINSCFDAIYNTDAAINGIVTSVEINCTNPAEQFVVNDNNEIEIIDKNDITKKLCDASVYEITHMKDYKTSNILKEKLLHNKKIKDIAEQMNENESNIKNKLYAGKRELSYILQTKYGDLFEMYLDLCKDGDSSDVLGMLSDY